MERFDVMSGRRRQRQKPQVCPARPGRTAIPDNAAPMNAAAPISPARIDLLPDGTPCAPDYGDVYHTTAGAFAQARHVFLGGNRLPGRWQKSREAW
jgi:hypothetical protein